MMETPLLEVDSLRIDISGTGVSVVRDATFSLSAGQVLGIVGESGSGKSLTIRAILGLLPRNTEVVAGAIRLEGTSLSAADESAWRWLRGRIVGLVPQEPLTALNPVHKVGRQVAEAPRSLLGEGRRAATSRALDVLRRVGLSDAERVAGSYPHELSGGMRQRAMIAMALACSPRLLLCDEPTTALDAPVQGRILDLLRSLALEAGIGVALVTHDLGVIARSCDEIAVMYAGAVVEQGPAREILESPAHPYTDALLRALPSGNNVDDLEPIPGQPPDPAERPCGCPFHPRCSFAQPECAASRPPRKVVGPEHSAYCILAKDRTNHAPERVST